MAGVMGGRVRVVFLRSPYRGRFPPSPNNGRARAKWDAARRTQHFELNLPVERNRYFAAARHAPRLRRRDAERSAGCESVRKAHHDQRTSPRGIAPRSRSGARRAAPSLWFAPAPAGADRCHRPPGDCFRCDRAGRANPRVEVVALDSSWARNKRTKRNNLFLRGLVSSLSFLSSPSSALCAALGDRLFKLDRQDELREHLGQGVTVNGRAPA